MPRRTTSPKNSPSGGSSSSSISDSSVATSVDNTSAITLPSFDLQSLLPSDLFSVSSSAPEIEKGEAEAMIERIRRQQNALDVAHENVTLLRKGIKLATNYEGAKGEFVKYKIARQNVQTELVNLDSAKIKTQIAEVKRSGVELDLKAEQLNYDNKEAMLPILEETLAVKLEKGKNKLDELRAETEAEKNVTAAKIAALTGSATQ